jgi:hypothetical protein
MVREPGIRKEFDQPIGGMRRQTLQYILEIGEQIDLMTVAAPHEAIQSRRSDPLRDRPPRSTPWYDRALTLMCALPKRP